MEELKGAVMVCQRMREDQVDILSFDTNRYWNIMEEEEKNGHPFMDIAKDIVQTEKKVITGYFSWTDANGNPYDSLPHFIRDVGIAIVLSGCLACLLEGEWNVRNFLGGLIGILLIMLVEVVISIPLYFLGKKFKWIEKNRTKVLVICCLILCVVLFAVSGLV
jgi:hypothetical protein